MVRGSTAAGGAVEEPDEALGELVPVPIHVGSGERAQDEEERPAA